MRQRLTLLPLLFAWLLATGSQWDLVQTFAWGSMFVQYSQTMSVAQAARLTFTPTNMCSVCKVVESARQQQDNPAQPEARAPGKLFLALAPAPGFVRTAPRDISLPAEARALVSAEPSTPPSPPPRVLA